MAHLCRWPCLGEISVSMNTTLAWRICASFSVPGGFCRNETCICPKEGWAALDDLTLLGRAQPLWLQLGKPPAVW